MITDDEVMRLFERADPARADDGASVIDVAGHLDALRTRTSYVTTVETAPSPAPRPAGPTSRHRWRVMAAAAAAGVLIVGGALLLASRDDATGPVTDQARVATDGSGNPPVDASAVRAASGFLTAYGAYDADQAIAYLADDADLSQMGAAGGLQGLRRLTSWLDASGYEQDVHSCEELASSDAGTSLRCPFAFHALRSDQLGRGPFHGSYFDLIVRDGEIVRASTQWDMGEFSPQVWEPFAAWVSTAHPEDAAVMYTDETHSQQRLTEASIRLWDRHTRDYVEAEGAELVHIAERFMAARNAYDTETALSLVADDGAAAQLCDQSSVSRWACIESDPTSLSNMGRVPLNPDELALAFEAERLYGVRYEPFTCEKASPERSWVGLPPLTGSDVTCTYVMDTRLRRIAGDPPIRSSSRLTIEDGRVRVLSFPWLNIGFSPGGFHPAEAAPFVRWLGREHPEVLDLEHLMDNDGPVFRTQGQELMLALTRESLDLLAGYLEEYKGSSDQPGN